MTKPQEKGSQALCHRHGIPMWKGENQRINLAVLVRDLCNTRDTPNAFPGRKLACTSLPTVFNVPQTNTQMSTAVCVYTSDST